MEETRENTIYSYTKWNEKYPKRLLHFNGMPPRLFVKGKLPREDIPTIAIVGARMCSYYGRVQAYEFAKVFAEAGVQVISGMAKGIDGYAHRGALDAGADTYAVLGCGLDICYPKENFDLYQKIQVQGGLISEQPNGCPPMPKNFPLRNRIISGLADAILIIEAKERSGSLITADLALDQGKSVFALPGRVSDELSNGCNRLIYQGAGIAITPELILNELQIHYCEKKESGRKSKIRLESKKNMLYSCLDLQPRNLNELVEKISLPLEETIGILLELELEGLVNEPMKNYYARVK